MNMLQFADDLQLKATILRQYDANMAHYAQKKAEVEAFLRDKEPVFGLCLRFLYGHMPANDVLSFPVEMMAGYVEATLEACRQIPYIQQIPCEIFLSYVLSYRVNSECLDGSRGELMKQILPFVQGKTMTQAALAVNYWCYGHATYTPADDRTLGPLSVMRRTLGRCGEESVLAVAALRSVGIPARQVYCPRWSHCDDNHAWVEVWVDGDWHYLGACEPEPVLDKGWFTAAASRAMLVHSKQWSPFAEGEVLSITPLYKEVSCTGRYGDLRWLTVQVLQGGKPRQGAQVAFQIINYSELFTLHCGVTDEVGCIRFETGLGDLCVSVSCDGKMLLKKVDMRCQMDVLTLDLAEAVEPEALPREIMMDLVPPVGKSDVVARVKDPLHQQRLAACEANRGEIVAAFADSILPAAAGNWPQIQAFFADETYNREEKETILRTLRPKDLVDITCQTLLDAMDAAKVARGKYPPEIYRDYILAPRIADEMLQPERSKIRHLFPDGFAGAKEILVWLREHLRIVDDYGANNYYPSAYGCLYYRQVPAFAFDMVFVAVCRAFGFPARLEPATGEGQWLEPAGTWHSIRSAQDAQVFQLTLENHCGQILYYNEHFALSRFDGHEFSTLRYPELTVEQRCSLAVQPGLYRLITTTRQIDGTASVCLRHFQVAEDTAICMELPEDQTRGRLQQVQLDLPTGAARDALSAMAGRGGVLIFADPGSEPTEHLLQEMLDCADGFRSLDCPTQILVAEAAMLENATLRNVERRLPTVTIRLAEDPEGEAALHRLMQVGDLRLPFAVSVDENGRGVYASANYNIRTAQTHLRIQKLIREGN